MLSHFPTELAYCLKPCPLDLPIGWCDQTCLLDMHCFFATHKQPLNCLLLPYSICRRTIALCLSLLAASALRIHLLSNSVVVVWSAGQPSTVEKCSQIWHMCVSMQPTILLGDVLSKMVTAVVSSKHANTLCISMSVRHCSADQQAQKWQGI